MIRPPFTPSPFLSLTRFLTCLSVGIVTMGICSIASAQLFGGKSIDKKFVSDTACLSATLFPKQLAEDPKYDLFPREIVTAWGMKELGFDPMKLRQITLTANAPEGMMQLQMGPPEWSVIMHFEEMQGLSGQLIDRLEQKKKGDRTLFSSGSPMVPSFLIYDEATMFAGSESMFDSMISSTGKSNLASMMKAGDGNAQALIFVDIEPLRPLLNELAQQLPPMLPPAITKLKLLPNMLKGIELTAKVNDELETNFVLHFIDDDAAEEGEEIISDAIDLGKDLAIGGAATQFDLTDPVQEATLEYMQRMAEEYQTKGAPKLNGKSVSMALSNEAAIAPVLVGMLLPAVQQTRAAARRVQSMNNMRQMALASHNFASANGKFPAQANYDKNGKPLLSWRVHILPYIEEQGLYEQFRLDEPWDSPHNRKLIAKMPMVYQNPAVAPGEGKTVYLGVAGEQGLFGKNARGFADITDGTSNTAMLVEADPSKAVEWTKPSDFEFNARRPMDGFGNVHPGGIVNVTFADGSVRAIAKTVDPEVWKAILTINGGEVVDPNQR